MNKMHKWYQLVRKYHCRKGRPYCLECPCYMRCLKQEQEVEQDGTM